MIQPLHRVSSFDSDCALTPVAARYSFLVHPESLFILEALLDIPHERVRGRVHVKALATDFGSREGDVLGEIGGDHIRFLRVLADELTAQVDYAHWLTIAAALDQGRPKADPEPRSLEVDGVFLARPAMGHDLGMTDDSWRGWERRLGRVTAVSSSWQERTNRAEDVPPRSALGGDDTPNLRVSGLAWYSLIVAAEHLEFALEMMRATGTTYPTAYMTTLRSALLAASHAVWVLAPVRRVDRRGRAMRLLIQDLTDQRKLVESATGLTEQQVKVQAHDAKVLTDRLDLCHATVAELGLARSSKAALNNTEVVTSAAQHLHDDPVAASGMQLLWRMGSAAAHGQRSYALMRIDRNVTTVGADGSRTMQLRGDLVHDIGPAAAAAALAINEAFRLFDLRCGRAPLPGQQLPRFIDL